MFYRICSLSFFHIARLKNVVVMSLLERERERESADEMWTSEFP